MASLYKPSSRSAPPPCQSRSGLAARPTAPRLVVKRQVLVTGGTSSVQQPPQSPLRFIGEATVIPPAGLGFPAREWLPLVIVHNKDACQHAQDVVYTQATAKAIKEVYTSLGSFTNGTQEMPSLGRGAGVVLQEVATKVDSGRQQMQF
ncbi:hypothetical protein CHLRE_21g752147v5 [Chlamydomonas reinhardtii]|uniref:Uncharacterized protein n=1 Tax=Chlamydomonas reinhardtii TaxID=3055 RepID=A0A2K3CN90_CHLRE|nr:uncharacterized protein CHLRE_21g752147v5 [Chlamydomonas reinhardtii]PNW69750.1 hypothetical protein CHLRE_21g752147v5 [Chlamydomonas reinhardtii]